MIAFIYEGESTEYGIFQNLKKNFFQHNVMEIPLGGWEKETIVDGSYLGNIYDLYVAISNDEDLDIIELVKERIQQSKKPKTIKKYAQILKMSNEDFSAIYLFFDCDPQHYFKDKSPDAKFSIIEQMLNLFNNETEHGKLYISYPMIEAIKDLQPKNNCFEACTIKLEDCTGRIYKSLINKRGINFLDAKHYELAEWKHFTRHAAMKCNCIINNNHHYELPSYKFYIENINQLNIFQEQFLKLANKTNPHLSILSSIPLFLLDEFGEACWQKNGLLDLNNNKYKEDFKYCSNNVQ